MRVYLTKNVEKIGLAGEIVKVSDGYATNFLFPHKLAVKITPKNESFYKAKVRVVENRKEAIETETSMLAEKIKALEVIVKGKMHTEDGDSEKLYGSISSKEIAEALSGKGVKVSKSQIKIDKAIKKKGKHKVTVKLSSRLQPTLIVNVVPE